MAKSTTTTAPARLALDRMVTGTVLYAKSGAAVADVTHADNRAVYIKHRSAKKTELPFVLVRGEDLSTEVFATVPLALSIPARGIDRLFPEPPAPKVGKPALKVV